MLEIIKWNSRHKAREWMTVAGALVVQLSALNAKRQKGEGEPRRPPWKRFDDTHHWDSAAEEWVPNNEVIEQRAMGSADRISRLREPSH
jgi:hypothetical protein